MSSLIDALLLEAPSSLTQLPRSFEVWIASGTGGGTGTQSDPYRVGNANDSDAQIFEYGLMSGTPTGDSTSGYYGRIWQTGRWIVVAMNVIDLDVDNPILFSSSGNLNFFNNLTPAGQLIRGYDQDRDVNVEELADEIEDGVLLSLME